MGYLNPGTYSKHGCFWQDQIPRTICHEPHMLMDVFGRTTFQGPFDMNQMSQLLFWAGAIVLQGFLLPRMVFLQIFAWPSHLPPLGLYSKAMFSSGLFWSPSKLKSPLRTLCPNLLFCFFHITLYCLLYI